MGLEYTLEISTSQQPSELLQSVFDDAPTQSDDGGWTLIQPGFKVRATPILHPYPLASEMGIASNLKLVMELSGMVNYGGVMSNILDTVKQVIEYTHSDLIFYVAEVDVLLWRKSGGLCLNQHSSFWSPVFLAQIDLPYNLQEIKSLVEV